MKFIITTLLGDFSVNLSYAPTQGDFTLNRFTAVINRYATQPLLIASESHSELDTVNDSEKLAEIAFSLLTLDDEAKMEKALYESTCTGGGAGRRLEFSLAKREIDISTF